jgi:hypothetical protein
LNGLFDTQGKDLLNISVGFTIWDSYYNTDVINNYPDKAAKMVYTNVFYNQQQDSYYTQTDLISGQFLSFKDLNANETYQDAFVYNYDLDYLDLRQDVYIITSTENTNWYGNDNNGVILLMKQKLKDKDYINSVYVEGKFYPTSGQTSSSTSNITVEDLGKLTLSYKNGKYVLKPEFNCRCSLSGVNTTFTWGYWESAECGEDIFKTYEVSNSLTLTYKKNNDYDILLKNLMIMKPGIMKRYSYNPGDYLPYNRIYYLYFPYLNGSRNRIKICKKRNI